MISGGKRYRRARRPPRQPNHPRTHGHEHDPIRRPGPAPLVAGGPSALSYSRRRCSATPLDSSPRDAASDTATRRAWLRAHAARVASIDPADEDFSDLAPLGAAIGDARIVQLGESSHGAGATFSAKVRLIKYLHQSMGFDVLVWESGLYDVAKTNESLRADGDPTEAGQQGVFGIWSRTVEVQPLWEYARASWSTQFSGAAGRGYFDDLAAFVDAAEDAALSERTASILEDVEARNAAIGALNQAQGPRLAELREEGLEDAELFAALNEWRDEQRPVLGASPDDRDAYRRGLTALHDLIRDSEALRRAHSARRIAFVLATIVNAREYGTTLYERSAADAPAGGTPEAMAIQNGGWNRRDTRNAEIMRWLADEHYAGRKIIVWAHNGHIMNAYYRSDWTALSLEPQPGSMKPVGVFLDEQLGEEVYTIGFTAFEGSQRQQGGTGELPVNAAPDGSLEHDLHALGEPHLFVDFRRLDAHPDHWLRQPSRMAIRGYKSEELPDWTRVVDAMFYIDVMTPSHWIKR